REGVTLRGLSFDVMLASYVLDPGSREHGLDALALAHFGVKTQTREELCGKGREEVPIEECALDRVTPYAAEKADLALRLRAPLEARMAELALDALYRDIEMPLVEALAEMEWHGIRIDREFFAAMAKRLNDELALIQREI